MSSEKRRHSQSRKLAKNIEKSQKISALQKNSEKLENIISNSSEDIESKLDIKWVMLSKCLIDYIWSFCYFSDRNEVKQKSLSNMTRIRISTLSNVNKRPSRFLTIAKLSLVFHGKCLSILRLQDYLFLLIMYQKKLFFCWYICENIRIFLQMPKARKSCILANYWITALFWISLKNWNMFWKHNSFSALGVFKKTYSKFKKN